MTLEDDVIWLLSIFPPLKDLKYLEPSAHAFSVFFSLKGVTFDTLEIAKLSLVGLIATAARMKDEERFHNINPEAFLQVANNLLDEEDKGQNYSKLLRKITNKTNINTGEEESPDVKK